jgi:hypothetical protein
MNSGLVEAGGTGIEPATCGFGESGTAFFPVLSRLASEVRPEFKPFLVSSRLSTSEFPAVKSAVNTTPPSPLHQFSKENVFHLPIWTSKLTTEEVLDQHSDDDTLVHDAHDRLDCGDPRLRQFNRIKM